MLEEHINKRKDSRFIAREELVAVVKGKFCSKFGIINDISRRGLAFRYLATEFECEEDPKELCELNIVYESSGLSFSIGSCKIIKDNYVPPEYSFCLGLMRKCSVQFGDMTPAEKSRLEYFINNFTEASINEPSYITFS